jgi:hypothetical protein
MEIGRWFHADTPKMQFFRFYYRFAKILLIL